MEGTQLDFDNFVHAIVVQHQFQEFINHMKYTYMWLIYIYIYIYWSVITHIYRALVSFMLYMYVHDRYLCEKINIFLHYFDY
jgi:hypothetical protein